METKLLSLLFIFSFFQTVIAQNVVLDSSFLVLVVLQLIRFRKLVIQS